MTRMTGPDCVGMCDLIITDTHTRVESEKNVEKKGLVQ